MPLKQTSNKSITKTKMSLISVFNHLFLFLKNHGHDFVKKQQLRILRMSKIKSHLLLILTAYNMKKVFLKWMN
jgi:hypothetical protein